MKVAVPGVCSKSLLLLVVLIVARAAGQKRKCVHDACMSKYLSTVHCLEVKFYTCIGWCVLVLFVHYQLVSVHLKGKERGSNAKTYICINFCTL